jgi:hypothetical protein
MTKKKGKFNPLNHQKMNSRKGKVMNKFIGTLRLKNKISDVEGTVWRQILPKPLSES